MIPRKRCPKCKTVYEGETVAAMYSCEQCGNGSLVKLPPRPEADQSQPLPRSGGGGTITHTRDNF